MTATPILILTGPPGAGKSTVARRLAEGSARPAVHMHTDDFFAYIRSGLIAPWLPESAEQNRTISRAIAMAAVAYAKGGYRVVIDGVVGPWHLDIYREVAFEADVALAYAVIRPDRETCVARARDRAETPLPDYPPNVYEGFADLGPLETHVVATDGLAPDAVARRIDEGLRGRGGLRWPSSSGRPGRCRTLGRSG